MTKESTLPTDWKNCYLVFHGAADENGYGDSLYARSLQGFNRKKNGNTNGPDFYSIRSSSYGIKVPTAAVGWAIVRMTSSTVKTLVIGEIPQPMTKVVQTLSDGRAIYMRRSEANMWFTITVENVHAKIPLHVES